MVGLSSVSLRFDSLFTSMCLWSPCPFLPLPLILGEKTKALKGGAWEPCSYLDHISCLSSVLQCFSSLWFNPVCEWFPLWSLLECPVEGMLRKSIIVLHNCPVLRDARLPLAPEQTLLSGGSPESRAKRIWEVALSSTQGPQRWPLPQLW